MRTCLSLIGTQPWDEISMAAIADAAGVSKPLLYHYFSTKSDLYLAAVQSAALELSVATLPDVTLPVPRRLLEALEAHVDWVDQHANAYRAILHGGLSSNAEVQAIVERSRVEVVYRIAGTYALDAQSPLQRIAIRGWIGFLESACIDWLGARDISKVQLVRLLASSLPAALGAVEDREGLDLALRLRS